MIMNYCIKIQWANITFFSSCIIKRSLLASLLTRNAVRNQVLVSIHFRLSPGWFTTCKGQYWKLLVVLRQPNRTNGPKSKSIIRPTALWDLTSVCYSNTRTCIKYANSVDPAQTPDQRPFDGDTRHLFAESQTQIGKLQVSKWQITYKFVYINDYCLMSFWTRLNSKLSSDVNRHTTVMYFHFRQYLLELLIYCLYYMCV